MPQLGGQVTKSMHRRILVHSPGRRDNPFGKFVQPRATTSGAKIVMSCSGSEPVLQTSTSLVTKCSEPSHGIVMNGWPFTVALHTMLIGWITTAAVSLVLTWMPLLTPTPLAVTVLVTLSQCTTPATIHSANAFTASEVGKLQPARLITLSTTVTLFRSSSPQFVTRTR